jgi:hypothetical protein
MRLGPARRTESGGERVERQRRAMAGAGEVCRRRVGERAELGEIASAAEGRPLACEHHLRDGRVEAGDLECFEQCPARRWRTRYGVAAD